jgi:hypothetical protein
VGRWDEARESPSVESEIEAVQARAQADGVDSTPTLIITGPGVRESLWERYPSRKSRRR